MKKIKQISIIFGVGTVLGILLLLTASDSVSAAGVCPDDGDWGVTSGDSSNPGGLVVRTVHENGTNIDVSFTLSTVDTDGGGGDIAGLSIVENNASFNPINFVSSRNFATGSTFYCGGSSDTYTGYLVLGFGSTNSNGNRWTLWCQEVTAPWVFVWNDEEFKITNLPAVGGKSGYWTGDTAGWDTGFQVGNGSTKRVTLTWHEYTNTLTVNSSGASNVGIGGSQGGTGGTTSPSSYTVTKTGEDINTDLTAPATAEGGAKDFDSWSGCDAVAGLICGVNVNGGGSQTVTANYKDAKGWIQGRIWWDNNGNGAKEGSEPYIRNSAAACAGYADDNARVDYAGPEVGTRWPTLCDSDPYYNTGLILKGNYTVTAHSPPGWVVTTANAVPVTVNPSLPSDQWFGMRPLVDIEITSADLVPATGTGPGGTFHKEDPIKLTVNFKNNGTGPILMPFKVYFCSAWNGTSCDTSVGKEETVTITCPPCSGGAFWSQDFYFTAPNENNTFTWYVFVDSDNEVGETNETNNKSSNNYEVKGVRAWFLAADGNVGSLGNITILKPPPIGYSTTYMGIAQGAITIFNSAKGWIISGYDPINLKPAPVGGSIYDVLLTKYKPKTVPNINAAIPAGGGIFKYTPGGGTLALNNTNWTKGPTMVFVEGKLRFNGNFTSNASTGMVFVVKGDVEIQSNVTTVAAVIFFDGNFKSGRSGVGNPDDQLRMIGGIVGGFRGGSTITLERDLGINNDTLPAEEFKFEPKYLWYFKELIGELKPVFEELTP